MGEGHRPGVFKRPAKQHKNWKGHSTKGQLDKQNRGRVAARDVKRTLNRSVSKEQRRQQTVQRRTDKRKAALEERRKYLGSEAPPSLSTVIVLGNCVHPQEFVSKLSECDETIVNTQGKNVMYFAVPRFKARIGFLIPDITVIDDVLDCLKVSDSVSIVWPLSGEISKWEELLISAIKSHGMPTYINIAPGLASIQSGKKKDEARKSVVSLISKWNLTKDKLYSADSPADGVQIIRAIIETKKTKLILQQRRAHLLVEGMELSEEQNGVCTLKASGYLRGPSLNVNRLVHLPGWGDFQISKVESHVDPHPLKETSSSGETKILAQADPEKQESLQSEMVPDPLDGEQTWPDEHDIVGENEMKEEGEKKRVPKGTSAYQAAWIVDSDEEDLDGEEDEEDDDDDDDEDEEEEIDMEGLEPTQEEEEDMEDIAINDAATEAASEMMEDVDIDMSEVEKYRKEREDAQFPDEIDTPIDIPARVRFQKFRGMKSFRTSAWDPLENLPYDYARIFKFQNFKKTKKTVLNSIESDGDESVNPGQYVTIYIQNVPSTFQAMNERSSPLVIYQLLRYEQKMSILNLVIRKHHSCTVPIMSKTKLIFHVGFRKFEAEPIFSQHTTGDKYKMERFLPQSGACVASVFAPISFPPSSVLVFRKDGKGRQELVASGSVLDNNPDRIVLKRVVLSGHPFKINKRSVVCRYMFFNREDIEWFKPVELYTPSGRRGHIKEPIGTHGHMKCKFDQQLNAQDSVMMSLYKRVFPKWTFNPRIEQLEPSRVAEADIEMSES